MQHITRPVWSYSAETCFEELTSTTAITGNAQVAASVTVTGTGVRRVIFYLLVKMY